MIDPRASDLLLYITAVTVAIGMVVMLFGLLVPRERAAGATVADSAPNATLAQMIADGPAVLSDDPSSAVAATIAAPPEIVKESTFAAIVAEAKRQADPLSEQAFQASALDETEGGLHIDEMMQAPLVADLADGQQRPIAPVDRSALSKRITWPSLLDESAVGCDLPTRLRLIEALSFIGGSWSIDILARAYEQELDANVRGAIFVALRDARSAA